METSLAIFILQEAVQNAPAIYAELQKLFTKSDPTPEDWADLRARVKAKDYRAYVPATALPAVPPQADKPA